MKNEAIAGAVTDLRAAILEVIGVHERLEDDDGGLGRSVIEEKFSSAISSLEDLAVSVREAGEERRGNGQK